MLKTLQQKDIVLFGEFHNNAIAHWLQLEVTKDCDATRDLVLGAEMFEQDNQQALVKSLQKDWTPWPAFGKTIRLIMPLW